MANLSDLFEPSGKLKPKPGSINDMRGKAARAAIGKHEMDMSPGYGGDYKPGGEVPDKAKSYETKTREAAENAPPGAKRRMLEQFDVPGAAAKEPSSVAPIQVKGTPTVGAGLYTAEGDDWTYEIQPDGQYRAKEPGGSWISITPANEPKAHAAITKQLEVGTLKRALQMG